MEKRISWVPSKEKLDFIRNDLGYEAAEIFHRKYRIAKERCCNPNNKDYDKYKEKFKFIDFVDFFNSCYEDFKKSYIRYGKSLSIDRIDGDLGYEKGNVRFVPISINLKNKSIVIPVELIDTYTGLRLTFNTFGEARECICGSGAMYKAMINMSLYRNRYLVKRM